MLKSTIFHQVLIKFGEIERLAEIKTRQIIKWYVLLSIYAQGEPPRFSLLVNVMQPWISFSSFYW